MRLILEVLRYVEMLKRVAQTLELSSMHIDCNLTFYSYIVVLCENSTYGINDKINNKHVNVLPVVFCIFTVEDMPLGHPATNPNKILNKCKRSTQLKTNGNHSAGLWLGETKQHISLPLPTRTAWPAYWQYIKARGRGKMEMPFGQSDLLNYSAYQMQADQAETLLHISETHHQVLSFRDIIDKMTTINEDYGARSRYLVWKTNYIPQIMWSVITNQCPKSLLLAQHSSDLPWLLAHIITQCVYLIQ